MAFEHYIQQGKKRLRCGYTTGSCAALAAKAAARMLLTGKAVEEVTITTPKGLLVTVTLQEVWMDREFVTCGVIKDAGDDIDVTAGALICAKAEKSQEPGVQIDGGTGVGRVTKPGLEQPVGAAAINSTPRRMIEEEVSGECRDAGWEGGIRITVSVPKGEEMARKTFNPRLGVEGGISILGTSGIVEPQSVQALIDTIEIEIRQLAASGSQVIVLTPGNYGEDYMKTRSSLASLPQVKCSNYIGDAIDFSVAHGFRDILLVGHVGKLVKLAGGIMQTHSRTADCRMELFTAHAALAGASQETARLLMEAATTDACIEILDREGLREIVMGSLMTSIQDCLEHRAGEEVRIGAVLFSNQYGILGENESAAAIMASY